MMEAIDQAVIGISSPMWSGTHGITDYEAPAGLYMLRAVDVITVTSTVRVDVAVTIRVDVAVTIIDLL